MEDRPEVARLLDRQDACWANGVFVKVEQLLADAPAVRADEQAVLKLIRNEVRLRTKLDAPQEMDYLWGEFRGRFPDLVPLIDLQAEFERVILRPGEAASADWGLEQEGPGATSHLPGDGPNGLDLRHYELLGPLGSGGMGEVYRSRDPGLGRPLALKALKPECNGNVELEARLRQEALIAGSLQHPNIVPVHSIGRLRDGRLFFTMKVVRGQTFGELLAKTDEPTSKRLAKHLAIFEQVCQAISYAHSKGVCHRDLKPGNIMVGRFGEVQVMDWGLAKVLLQSGAAEERPSAGASEVVTLPPEEARPQTHDLLGTPDYLAPEQANNEKLADERVDVFGLGGILCEALTGKPPYRGDNRNEKIRKAQRGDLTDAFERLDNCGADPILVKLAKECLCPEISGRPASGVVAERVAAYFAEVQKQLQATHVEREKAAIKVQEARKRGRMALVLAAALALAGLTGAGLAWRETQKWEQQSSADRNAHDAFLRGLDLATTGWDAQDQQKLIEAKAEADRAVGIARSGGASETVQKEAVALQRDMEERLHRLKRNRVFRDSILEASVPRETNTYKDAGWGRMIVLPQLSVDEQLASAFWRWREMKIDDMPESRIVAMVKEEPRPMLEQVIAALDYWVFEQRRANDPKARWARLLRVAEQLDWSAQRHRLRASLGEKLPPRAESVAGLLGSSPPWASLWDLERGGAWRHARELRGEVRPTQEPVLTVLLLARVCLDAGDQAGAEQVLRQGLSARPNEVVLLNTLGALLELQGPARLGEAIECYRAIRARSPELGVALGKALVGADRAAEGAAVFDDLARQQPKNPQMHFYLGYARSAEKKLGESEAAYKEAIRLKRAYPEALNNLGYLLNERKKYPQAMVALNEAIRLKTAFPEAYVNLGIALREQGKLRQAEEAFRSAIRFKEGFANAHSNLGVVQAKQKKLPEAVASLREAIRLRPNDAGPHNNLGVVLRDQKNWPEAMASLKEAIRLDPDLAAAHYNLSNLLRDLGRHSEAEGASKEAIRLKRDYPDAHNALGRALLAQRRWPEAEIAFKEATRLSPDFLGAHNNLGNALREQRKFRQAAQAYRDAIRLAPDFSGAHYNLGNVLHDLGQLPEAEKAFRDAIRLKADFHEAHHNLGTLLLDRKKVPEAIEYFRGAIRIEPGYPDAHNSLGSALSSEGKWAEAVASLKKAIELRPDFPEAYHNLGAVFSNQRKWEEAETAFKQAIRLKPDSHKSHYRLGTVLRTQRKLPAAEASLKEAVRIKPDYLEALNALGLLLLDMKKWPEAAGAFQAAIRVSPKSAAAHFNLGTALTSEGKLAAAEAAIREGARLDPDSAEGHSNLGMVLRDQGRFPEALDSLRKGNKLGAGRPGWPTGYVAALIRKIERLVDLDRDLPAFLAGKRKASGAEEQLELADLCRHPARRLYAASAGFYEAALARNETVANNVSLGHRFNAACSALMADRGEDKIKPTAKEQARLRQQALDWLRADLVVLTKALDKGQARDRAFALLILERWSAAPHLASAREPAALAALPAEERKAWQKLWADRAALLERARGKGASVTS